MGVPAFSQSFRAVLNANITILTTVIICIKQSYIRKTGHRTIFSFKWLDIEQFPDLGFTGSGGGRLVI